MGKNWSGRGGGRGGGGGGGNDLSNCRGYAAVIGTCDAAREKESNKELTNLLSQAIERLYPRHDTQLHQEGSANKEDSIADLLQNELKQLQKQKHSGAQDVVSINIGIKGIVFAKITRRDVCPVKLVKDILDQVKTEKVPCSRHLVKVVPLQLVTFGGETEFISSAKILVEGHFGAETTGEGSTLAQIALSKVVHKRKADDLDGEIHECDDAGESAQKRVCVEESVPSSSARLRSGSNAQEEDSVGDDTAEVVLNTDPAPTTVDESAQESSTTVQVPAAPAAVLPEVRYFVLFKARNHNTLNKQLVIKRVKEEMPAHLRQDYLHGQNAVIVEALKNIVGVSYFPDYYKYSDLNLRKHQAEHCPQLSSTMLVKPGNSGPTAGNGVASEGVQEVNTEGGDGGESSDDVDG